MAYQRSQSSTTNKSADKYASKIASIKDIIIKEIPLSDIPQSNNIRTRREVLSYDDIVRHCMNSYHAGCTSSVKKCFAYSQQNTGSLLPC